MAHNKRAALALLIGLPLALHGHPIHMPKAPSAALHSPLTAKIQRTFPVKNLVSNAVLEQHDYALIRPVDQSHYNNITVADSMMLQTLAELSRKTQF